MIPDDIITYKVTDAKECKKRERKQNWFSRLFARKEQPHERRQEPEYVGNVWDAEWGALQRSHPVGHAFNYLGRKMIVTRHKHGSRRISVPKAFIYVPAMPPSLITEYADEHGQIHEHVFDIGSWTILSNGTPQNRTT